MTLKGAVKVTLFAHLGSSLLRATAAPGDAPWTTKFFYFLLAGDTPAVDLPEE